MIFDNLSTVEILKNVKTNKSLNISVFDEIDSTNTYLKNAAKQGAEDGSIVIAERQTDGHGRFERRFCSPEGTGIYMSILLRPSLTAADSVLLTAATAVAVCEAAEAVCDSKFQIKWVNDILKDGKKVCGILTEGAINPDTDLFEWVVIGIGINVYTPINGFDESIKDTATSVTDKVEAGLRNRLCAEIINRLSNYYKSVREKTFLPAYIERSAVLDKKISVIKGDEIINATAISIDENCRLEVQYEDGSTELLNSGEISTKIK